MPLTCALGCSARDAISLRTIPAYEMLFQKPRPLTPHIVAALHACALYVVYTLPVHLPVADAAVTTAAFG